MAKAPGSLAPRTDCLGHTRTLAGWPSSPGQRNTLWATSFSISQLVSLVCKRRKGDQNTNNWFKRSSIDLTSYLLRCRAVKVKASACELEAGTKKHQPCPYIVMFEKRQVLHLGWILFLSPGVNWPSQVSQCDPKNCSPSKFLQVLRFGVRI